MTGFSTTLRKDLLASIVVFLVALPLCMGIALASGAPPVAGILTGVVAGLVVGWLSGSPLQVSGPAAGLAVLVYDMIQRYTRQYLASRADPEVLASPEAMQRFLEANETLRTEATTYAMAALGLSVLLAGVIQFTAGLLRLGQWFRAVSPAVIHGMLAGIGVLIFASQFHVMVDDVPRGSGVANLLSLPEAVYKAVVPDENGTASHRWAARVGLMTIMTMVLWKVLAPKRLQVVPAPLVGVLVAIGESASLQLADLNVRHIDMPDNLLAGVSLLDPGLMWGLLTPGLIGAAVTIAAVASAETLLCATAVDQMHNGRRTRYDRELAAQGIGNMICGALSGLPMTGVIVRSATNVEAGAQTRLSAILHGLWLLVFVSLCPSLLRMIPTASLAAILVYTGYKLMNPRVVRELWSYGKGEAAIYAATVIAIVGFDLLTGVLLGAALSAAKLLHTFCRLSVRLEEGPDGQAVLLLRGAATFLRLPRLAAVLEKVPPGAELHVHFEQLSYIDHACLDLLINWEKQHEATGGSLVIDWDTLTARFHRPRTTLPDRERAVSDGQVPNGERAVEVGSPGK